MPGQQDIVPANSNVAGVLDEGEVPPSPDLMCSRRQFRRFSVASPSSPAPSPAKCSRAMPDGWLPGCCRVPTVLPGILFCPSTVSPFHRCLLAHPNGLGFSISLLLLVDCIPPMGCHTGAYWQSAVSFCASGGKFRSFFGFFECFFCVFLYLHFILFTFFLLAFCFLWWTTGPQLFVGPCGA